VHEIVTTVPVFFRDDVDTGAHAAREALMMVHLDEWPPESAPSHSGKLCVRLGRVELPADDSAVHEWFDA